MRCMYSPVLLDPSTSVFGYQGCTNDAEFETDTIYNTAAGSTPLCLCGIHLTLVHVKDPNVKSSRLNPKALPKVPELLDEIVLDFGAPDEQADIAMYSSTGNSDGEFFDGLIGLLGDDP